MTMLRSQKSLSVKSQYLKSFYRLFSTALNAPNSHDRDELFRIMGSRPGSLLSDQESLIQKYNQDWTVSYIYIVSLLKE